MDVHVHSQTAVDTSHRMVFPCICLQNHFSQKCSFIIQSHKGLCLENVRHILQIRTAAMPEKSFILEVLWMEVDQCILVPLALYRAGGGCCLMRSCISQGCVSDVQCHCVAYCSLSGKLSYHPHLAHPLPTALFEPSHNSFATNHLNVHNGTGLTLPFLDTSLTIYHSTSSGNLRVYPRGHCYS